MVITGFKASNGWIGRLKTRTNIKFATIHGEASSVPEETCIDWTQIKLPELIKDHEPQDVFNVDEFGLFWRLAPNKTYLVKGDNFKSGKPSKERI